MAALGRMGGSAGHDWRQVSTLVIEVQNMWSAAFAGRTSMLTLSKNEAGDLGVTERPARQPAKVGSGDRAEWLACPGASVGELGESYALCVYLPI
jgi:hypothetical protein